MRGGFVRCGHCGRKVHAATKAGRYPTSPRLGVYRTAQRQGEHYDCPPMSISARMLDAAVWARVEALLTDPTTVTTEVERLRKDDPTVADLRAVDRALAEVERKRTNLARRLALFDDDETAAPLVAELGALGKRRKQYEAERENLAAQRETWRLTQEGLMTLKEWCRRVGENLAEMTYEEKRQILVALDVRVSLWPASRAPRYTIRVYSE